MPAEIEAKFINVDHDEVRVKLKELGAVCEQPMRLMRRKNFDYPDGRLQKAGGWIRVRDEADKITLAYKQLDHRGVDGTKEVNVTVSSFDDTCLFLQSIGLELKSYQETKRESWTLLSAEIELDEWPWVRPYVEIEANDERHLFDIVRKLGFEESKALHGSVEVVYQAEYDVTEEEIDGWQEILFIDIPDELERRRRK